VKVTYLDEGPFANGTIEEVHLAGAPLVRVLAQVRFRGAHSLLRRGAAEIDDISVNLGRLGYVTVDEGLELSFELTADGVNQKPGSPVWAFHSTDQNWHVTLSPNFFSLHTSAYEGREDFVSRAVQVAGAISDVIGDIYAGRVGYRYINQLVGHDADSVRGLVRDELIGILDIPKGEVQLFGGLSEATFSFDQEPRPQQEVANGLQVRWGRLPVGLTTDPSLEPVSEKSWILDLDAFRNEQFLVKQDVLAARLNEFSERGYRFFRWAVTKKFLERYGVAR
jgi:uncharacterized protein (TIGR04255 family)